MDKKTLAVAILGAVLLVALFWGLRSVTASNKELTLYGNVDVRQVNLGFRVPGLVEKMVFEEGDQVRTGDIVAALDPEPYMDQLREARAQAASIKIDLANAETLLLRREELIGSGGVSQEEYDDAKTSYERLKANLEQAEAAVGVRLTNVKDTRVYAPTEGTILTRVREPGSVVREGDPVYSVSIIDPVWIRAFVSEPELGRIYPGMKAKILTDSNRTYEGHIGFISPVAEFTPKNVETTKLRVDLVYRIRVVADNPDHYLKQGMPVTVKLYDEGDRRNNGS